jgi:hypothetical protein
VGAFGKQDRHTTIVGAEQVDALIVVPVERLVRGEGEIRKRRRGWDRLEALHDPVAAGEQPEIRSRCAGGLEGDAVGLPRGIRCRDRTLGERKGGEGQGEQVHEEGGEGGDPACT